MELKVGEKYIHKIYHYGELYEFKTPRIESILKLKVKTDIGDFKLSEANKFILFNEENFDEVKNELLENMKKYIW